MNRLEKSKRHLKETFQDENKNNQKNVRKQTALTFQELMNYLPTYHEKELFYQYYQTLVDPNKKK